MRTRISVAMCALFVAACQPQGNSSTPSEPKTASRSSPLVGQDGTLSVSTNTVLNEYAVLSANAAVGATTITVSNASNLDSATFGALAAGDLLLIIQMQGATIDTTDTSAFGNVTALNSSGLYEFIEVQSIAGNVITVGNGASCTGLRNAYTAAGHTQVVRVPQLTTLTVTNTGTITAPPWDGQRGGIVALHVSGTMTVAGSVDVTGLGFRGGAVDNVSTAIGTDVAGYRGPANSFGGEKGESIAGFTAEYDALAGGVRYGRGAPANGGGGGNSHNAGGGGGANSQPSGTWSGQGVMDQTAIGGTAAWPRDPGYIANANAYTVSPGGGRGGYSTSQSNQNAATTGPATAAWGGNLRRERGGLGGRTLAPDAASRLFFGGGGGAGDGDNAAAGAGGRGGGLIYVMADTITGAGGFAANGLNGDNTIAPHNDAPGGAGAGGSIVLRANTVSQFNLSANGGSGGDQLVVGTDEAQGPGGGGGGGFIAVSSLAGTIAARSAAGGPNGTTLSNGLTEFPSNGATRGNAGNSAGNVIDVPLCLQPVQLAVTVTDGATSATPGNVISYTITITNAGPGNATRARLVDTAPGTLGTVTWTCTGSMGGVCSNAMGNNSINQFIDVPSGGQVQFVLTGTIATTATGSLANTATVYAPPTVNDRTPADNTATDTDTLAPIADLSMVLTDNPDGAVDEDAPLSYQLAVNNAGPSQATTVSVNFPLPSGVVYGSATGTGWTCAQASSIVTCTRATLPVGAAGVITVALTAPGVAPATLMATATVAATTTDPNANNNSSSQTTTVNPINDPPVNTVPSNLTVLEDGTLTITGTSIVDVDAQPPLLLDVSVDCGPFGTVAFSNTGGATVTAGNAMGASSITMRGTLTQLNAALASFSFRPLANLSGTLSITLTTNDLGNTGAPGPRVDIDSIVVQVTPTNDPPVAVADSVTVLEDSSNNTVLVLANDDISPDTGETLTVIQVSAAMHGIATGQINQVSYTPAANYFGPDSFTYTISDGNGGTATATVTVNVTDVNDPPVANDDSLSAPEGSTNAPLPVLANDSIAPDVSETLTVTAVTQPSSGSVTIAPGGTQVLYTPNMGFNGADTFTYTVSDGRGGTDTATVTVQVGPVNDPPVNTMPAAQTMAEDSTLVLSAASSNGISIDDVDVGPGLVQLTLSVTNGTITLAHTTGLNFSLGDGSQDSVMSFTSQLSAANTALDGLSFAPAANFNGTVTLSLTTNDLGNTGVGGAKQDTDTLTITVTPVNDPPTANNDTFTVVEDGPSQPLNVLANDSTAPDTGETLAVTQVTQPAHGTLVIAGNGASVSYTPSANYFGPDSFTYTVNDGNGGTASATATLTVTNVNDPPTARPDLYNVAQDSTGNLLDVLTNDSSDPDPVETLTIISVSMAQNGTVAITAGGGSLTYSPNQGFIGADSVAYSVADSNGGVSLAFVTITVGADRDRDGLPDAEELVRGTNPDNADTDGDGLKDGVEVRLAMTDPLDDDSDDDGLLDGNEDSNRNGTVDPGETDPKLVDTDGDGLQDGTELGLSAPQGNGTKLTVFRADQDPTTRTNPTKADTDGGGDADGVEDANHNGRIDTGETDPNNPFDDLADADRDGLADVKERQAGLNPNDADVDDDGVLDGADGLTDTDGDGLIDALDPDSDNDGIFDGTEAGITADTRSVDTDGTKGFFVADADPGTTTSPKKVDSDGDGINDGVEDKNHNGKKDDSETDAASADTDGDGLDDGLEQRAENPTDPLAADTDGDGLSDGDEDQNHNGRVDPNETDPARNDTDGGGTSDGDELKAGGNPLDSLDDFVVRGGGGCTAMGDTTWGFTWLAMAFGLGLSRRRRTAQLSRVTLPLVVLLTAFVVPTRAHAQTTAATYRGLDLQRVKPGPGPFDRFGVLVPQAQSHLQISARIFGGYADDPLVLASPVDRSVKVKLVDDQLAWNVSLGMGIKDWFAFDIQLPVLTQRGQTDEHFTPVSGTGIGDLRVVPRALALRGDRVFRLGFAVPVVMPTGNGAQLRGQGSFGVEPMVMAQLVLPVVRVAANVGVAVRGQQQLLSLTVGSELTWAALVEAPMLSGELISVLATVNGAVGFASSLPQSRPIEGMLGLNFNLSRAWAIQGGVGAGFNDGYGTPRWRAMLGVTFAADPIKIVSAPKPPPRAPEPLVPPVDEVNPATVQHIERPTRVITTPPPALPPLGKVFLDADGDGVADDVDRCPGPKETINGNADHDGCPDDGRPAIEIKADSIRLREKLSFVKLASDLTAQGLSVAKQLGLNLLANPSLKVRIEVYTTEEKTPGDNASLSSRRAQRIVDVLVGQGVDRSRFEAVGLGGARPMEDNAVEVLPKR